MLGPDVETSPQEGRCWMEPEPATLQNSDIRKGDMSKSIFIFFYPSDMIISMFNSHLILKILIKSGFFLFFIILL